MPEPGLESPQDLFQRTPAGQTGLLRETHDLQGRPPAHERQVAGIVREIVRDAEAVVAIEAQVDRLGHRLTWTAHRPDPVA